MTTFNVEEMNLLCVFDTTGRAALINSVRAALPDFYEPEMLEIARNALVRLEAMTDAEFAAVSLTPEYYFEDDETESEV